jgi:tetratricopeptide (TPR) repeat protein
MTSGIRVITKFLLLLGCAMASVPAAAADVAAIARQQQSAVAAVLSEPQRSALTQTAAASPTAAAAEGYGHALLMRRHLAPAAWMYAAAVEREPARGSAVTALGVTLVEGATTGGKSRASEADLAAAVELQREAVRLMPKEGVAHHNLGTALLRLAQARGNDRALLEEAAKSLRQAVALGGRRAPHFNVRLAEALNALGDRAGAAAALRQAFAVNPVDPILLMARVSSLADVPVQGDPPACKAVDFGCKKSCPQGITGRMMMVACEIANSNAVEACRAGKPYPTGYNCESKLPRFGISIPGLDPGFSIKTPWGSIDVTVQGDGRVDWRVSFHTPPVAGLKPFIGAQGSYQPSTGALNFSAPEATVQFSVNNSNFLMKQANAFNIGPSSMQRHGGPPQRSELGPELRLSH